jgi:hypothetical protein
VTEHLALAAAIGAHAIRVWGVRPAEGQQSEDLVPGTAEAIGQALSRDDSGVGIVMQNHLGFGTARDAVEVAQQLDAIGFSGFFSFKWEKIWNHDLADARVALPRFLAFMQSL